MQVWPCVPSHVAPGTHAVPSARQVSICCSRPAATPQRERLGMQVRQPTPAKQRVPEGQAIWLIDSPMSLHS